jgi:glycogen debranching enzyme
MPLTTTARVRELASQRAALDPARFVEVTGESAALFGREGGPYECWIWPHKVLAGLRLGLRRRGGGVALARRTVEVLPGELAFHEGGAGVELRTEAFACRERPGLALGFALDSDEPLEIVATFRCELRAMWPAGLGGALARVDRVTGALAITEELGRHAVLIGAPGARVELEARAHALPAGEVSISIPMQAGGASAVLAIAGGAPEPGSAPAGHALAARLERAIAATHELWWRLVTDFSEEREAVRAHWRAHRARCAWIESPDPALDQAFEWSQVAIERAWVRVAGLGRGLVAGFGESGAGERPGRAWFFDSDALAAARALVASGDFAGAREALRSVAAHQREDGALVRELPLSAGALEWARDYPYAYAASTAGAEFVSALELHLRLSGDLALARELMPAARRALLLGLHGLDPDGRLRSAHAGQVAPEEGPLAGRIESEAHVQGAWVAALAAGARLAQALGEEAPIPREVEARARAAFEAFWSEEHGRYGFARLADGTLRPDLSAWVAHPLARGLGERARATATVQALNAPALASDWGARGLALDSPFHDPRARDLGAVAPQLSNSVTLALFAHGHAFAAQQVLCSQVALTGLSGLGFLPGALDGSRACELPEGVPHQVAASAALVESVLLGLFGLEASAEERRVAFRPSLPPHWDEVRLANLAVGATRLDVRIYRRREPGATVLGLELERGEGPALALGFAPVLPPLSRLLDGPGWLRPAGAVVPRRLHRSAAEPLTLETRVLEGPAVLLAAGPLQRGAESTAARLVQQEAGPRGLRWVFMGRSGTRAALPFSCDFALEVEGAALAGGELHLVFPPGPAGGWTSCEVRLRAR